jgi:hypothetical protein
VELLRLCVEKAALHLPVPISGRNSNINYLIICEGCVVVVSGLPPPWFELRISRLPEKVVIPLDRPGPPDH